MDGRPEAQWAAFVAFSWPGLVRTATLLGGDPAAAEGLAAAALVRTRRRAPGRDGDSDRAPTWSQLARRILLRLPATPGARLRAWARGPAPAAVGDRDPLLQGYRALGPVQRALLVLTVADGLDVAAAAGVLGLPRERAVNDLITALDGLRRSAPAGLGAEPVVELDLGDLPHAAGVSSAPDELLARDGLVRDLRDVFTRLAAAAPVADDAPRRVDVASTADRLSRRRRLAVGLFLSVAVVAATAGVVRENTRIAAARQRAVQERVAYAEAHPSVLTQDVTRWPTRGSRARDARLLTDVEARVGGRPTVLFAGDVLGVDVVVALTGPGYEPLLHVLSGPRGSAVATWREAGAGLDIGTAAVPAVSAAVVDDQGRLHLLAVTLTAGVAVAYSPAAVLADDARVSRRYLRLPLTDGIGTAVVAASPGQLRMRIAGAGSEGIIAPLLVAPPSGPETVPALRASVTGVASCDGSSRLRDVPALVGEATDAAGLVAADITAVRMLWCRQDGREGEVAVALSARRGPDIQCYEAVEEAAGAVRTASQCWPVPRGSGVEAPFLAPPITAGDSTGDVLTLTVFAPGASTAEVHVGSPQSAPVARARVALDGYARFDLRTGAATPRDYLESQGFVSALDRRGGAVTFLPLESRGRGDVWGEGTDGPVVQP